MKWLFLLFKYMVGVTFKTQDSSVIYNLDNLPDQYIDDLSKIQTILQKNLNIKYKYVDTNAAQKGLSPQYKLIMNENRRTMNSIDPAALRDQIDSMIQGTFYQKIEVNNGFDVMLSLMTDTINNQESSYRSDFFTSSSQSEAKYFSYGFAFYSATSSSYCFLIITLISLKNQKVIFGIPQEMRSGIPWDIQVLKINDMNCKMINSPTKMGFPDKLTSSNGLYTAKIQEDGNFVIYDNVQRPLWASDTRGQGVCLTMQDDGNLVLYDNQNKPIWASGTNGIGRSPFKAILNDEAQLIIQDNNNRTIWRS
ncbi:alpha-D-mannose-specific plant lectin [Neoconidiobolus thromboides FSU 785]|nr:alpha-D-mannose-specific plant lectin [Neoconidiobolus thromboides FSU 785]